MSHYDSEFNSVGATDDGSGVVTLLETVRALRHHPPLRNDVVVLISDAEEIGLLGARAFAEQHPWMADVGVMLNFEGSGSAGQSLMFETSDGNRRLIREFARAAPFPAANSIAYEVYRRMPNDTDFSVFKEHGIPGLNFSCIEHRYDYHTLSDNVENIDERFVQHHGSAALPLTLHFGNSDLQLDAPGNAVYFNLVGYWLVHYAESWVIVWSLVTLAVFVVVVVIALRTSWFDRGACSAACWCLRSIWPSHRSS